METNPGKETEYDYGKMDVQGLAQQINEIYNEQQELKVDIAVLTETKKKG